jgi:tetratricopeptide (TPR) repeat protein
MGGQDEKAVGILEQFLLRAESNLPVRLELARIYKRKGQWEKFVDVLRQIIDIWPYRLDPRIAPGRFDTHRELAEGLLELGRSAEALEEARVALHEAQFGEVATQDGEETEVRLVVTRAALAAGDLEEAQTQIEEILEVLDPDNAKAKELGKELEERKKEKGK